MLLALAASLVFAVFSTAGCNQPASPRGPVAGKVVASEPCLALPLAPFDCAEEGGTFQTSVRFSGAVAAIEGPDEFGRRHYVVREASGTEHRLAVQPPDLTLPIESGHGYDFELDRVGGMPTASGLIIRDGEALVFAGASDQNVADHVLKDGVPGFGLELLASTCPSRGEGECYEAVFNLALQATHAGGSAALYQGQVARLGGYEVRCLIAQQVKYSARCSDFGLHAVSYIIARVK